MASPHNLYIDFFADYSYDSSASLKHWLSLSPAEKDLSQQRVLSMDKDSPSDRNSNYQLEIDTMDGDLYVQESKEENFPTSAL
jgi:hypothetical protein